MTTDDIKAPVGDPARVTVIRGVTYSMVPGGHTCEGCSGITGYPVHCVELPPGCSKGDGSIWKPAEVPSKAYKPAHGGYPGEVRSK
jgi:hypothetical protein